MIEQHIQPRENPYSSNLPREQIMNHITGLVLKWADRNPLGDDASVLDEHGEIIVDANSDFERIGVTHKNMYHRINAEYIHQVYYEYINNNKQNWSISVEVETIEDGVLCRTPALVHGHHTYKEMSPALCDTIEMLYALIDDPNTIQRVVFIAELVGDNKKQIKRKKKRKNKKK